MPGAVAVGAAGAAGINSVLPDLVARLASLMSWHPTPITLTAQLATMEKMIAALKVQIGLSVPPPSLASQLAALQDLIAALQAQVAALEIQLELITAFQAQLGAAGIHLVRYDGAVGLYGAELDLQLARLSGVGPLDHCQALTLLTTLPATFDALGAILKTEP